MNKLVDIVERELYFSKIRKAKGITLIALVITMIILLILVGISIAQLTGNGLFEKAKLSKEKQENAEIEENEKLGDYENEINKYISGQRDVELTQEIKDYIDAKINEISETKEGTITKSGTISELVVSCFKYNKNSVSIQIGINLLTELKVGQSVTIGRIDQEQCIPKGYGVRGIGYYGSRGFIGTIDTNGEISVRNIGTESLTPTATANSKLFITFNYNLL